MIPLSQEDTSRKTRVQLADTEHPTQYDSKLNYLVHTLSILGYGVIIFPDNIAVFRDGILVLIVQRGDQRKNR